MKRAFPSLMTVLVLGGCSTAPRRSSAVDDGLRRQTLAAQAQQITIDASDGISEVEAYKIAEEYFLTKNGNLCGIVGLPKEERAIWRVPIYEGYVGVHTKDVVIDSKSGSYQIEAKRQSEPNQPPEPTR